MGVESVAEVGVQHDPDGAAGTAGYSDVDGVAIAGAGMAGATIAGEGTAGAATVEHTGRYVV